MRKKIIGYGLIAVSLILLTLAVLRTNPLAVDQQKWLVAESSKAVIIEEEDQVKELALKKLLNRTTTEQWQSFLEQYSNVQAMVSQWSGAVPEEKGEQVYSEILPETLQLEGYRVRTFKRHQGRLYKKGQNNFEYFIMPADGQAILCFSRSVDFEPTSKASLCLVNHSGQTVYDFPMNKLAGQTELPLPAGVYFIEGYLQGMAPEKHQEQYTYKVFCYW